MFYVFSVFWNFLDLRLVAYLIHGIIDTNLLYSNAIPGYCSEVVLWDEKIGNKLFIKKFEVSLSLYGISRNTC
jgi:hypothetical protein